MFTDYKTKEQLIADGDFLQPGEDFLDVNTLTWPHENISNNLDIIRSKLNSLVSVAGVMMETGIIENLLPDYSDPNTGKTSNYLRNGTSFKEAIITLDKKVWETRNFILGKINQPNDPIPVITPDNDLPIIPPTKPDEFILVPGAAAYITTNNVYNTVVFPTNSISGLSPRIFIAGYDSPQHLVAISRGVWGSYRSVLMESKDAGKSWTNITNFLINQIAGGGTEWMAGWVAGYKKELTTTQNPEFEFAYMIEDTYWKHRGTAYYNKTLKRWVFPGYSSGTAERVNANDQAYNIAFHSLCLNRSKTATRCLAAFTNYLNTALYVCHSTKHFTAWGPGDFTPPTGTILIRTPGGDNSWNFVYSPDIIQLGDNSIWCVFCGRETSTDKIKVYISKSSDNGATFGDAEEFLGSDAYNYSSPSIIQLDNNRLAITFATDESTDYLLGAYSIYKVITSNDGGATWGNQNTIYTPDTSEPIPLALITATNNKSYLPGTKLLYLANGEILCFIEKPLYYSATSISSIRRQLVRVNLVSVT